MAYWTGPIICNLGTSKTIVIIHVPKQENSALLTSHVVHMVPIQELCPHFLPDQADTSCQFYLTISVYLTASAPATEPTPLPLALTEKTHPLALTEKTRPLALSLTEKLTTTPAKAFL